MENFNYTDFEDEMEKREFRLYLVAYILFDEFDKWLEENWKYIRWAKNNLEIGFEELMTYYLDKNWMGHLIDSYEKECAVKAAI